MTQLWLGPQATEQHASLSINTAPRRPLKPNFETYLVCQEPFLVVTKTWVWWSYLRNLQPTIFLLQDVTVARQRSTRNAPRKRFLWTSVSEHLAGVMFLGGSRAGAVLRELPRNVDATLERKFRNLNEKMTAGLEKSSEI